MKKGKNALIIFIFLILAILLLVILVPAAMENNKKQEENLNNEENINNENLEIEEVLDNEDVINQESGTTLKEERELEIDRKINDYAPIKTEENGEVEVVSVEWIGDDKAMVEYKDTETYFAEFEFTPNTPIIILSTQIVQEEE